MYYDEATFELPFMIIGHEFAHSIVGRSSTETKIIVHEVPSIWPPGDIIRIDRFFAHCLTNEFWFIHNELFISHISMRFGRVFRSTRSITRVLIIEMREIPFFLFSRFDTPRNCVNNDLNILSRFPNRFFVLFYRCVSLIIILIAEGLLSKII